MLASSVLPWLCTALWGGALPQQQSCAAAAARRSLVLADPWDPPVSLPTQFLTQLTHLSFLAEGLLVPHLAAQFCAALSQLQQLRQLALCRLQLSAQAAQQLAQALTELPHLEHLALSGGAAPVSTAELYVLLNGERLAVLPVHCVDIS